MNCDNLFSGSCESLTGSDLEVINSDHMKL